MRVKVVKKGKRLVVMRAKVVKSKSPVVTWGLYPDGQYICEYHTGDGSADDKKIAQQKVGEIWKVVKGQANNFKTIQHQRILLKDATYRYAFLIPRQELKEQYVPASSVVSVGIRKETLRFSGKMSLQDEVLRTRLLSDLDKEPHPRTYQALVRLYRSVDLNKLIFYLEKLSEANERYGYGDGAHAANATELAAYYEQSGDFEKALSKSSEVKRLLDRPDLKLDVAVRTSMLQQAADVAHRAACQLVIANNDGMAVVRYLSLAIDIQINFPLLLLKARSHTYVNLCDYENALKDLNQVLEREPCATAFVNRGICFHAQEKYALALQDVSAALACDPEFSKAQGLKTLILKKLGGTPTERRQLLERAVKNHAREHERRMEHLEKFVPKHDPRRSMIMKKFAREKASWDMTLLAPKFNLYYEQGQYKQAIQVGRKLLAILDAPEEISFKADVYFQMSEAFYEDKQYGLAMQYIKKAIAVNDSRPSYHCTKAKIFLHKKDRTGCRHELDIARDLLDKEGDQLRKDKNNLMPSDQEIAFSKRQRRHKAALSYYEEVSSAATIKKKEPAAEPEQRVLFKIMLVAHYAREFPEESADILQFLVATQVRGKLFVKPKKMKGLVKSRNGAAEKKFSKNYYAYFKDPNSELRLSVEKVENTLWIGKERTCTH